MENDQEVVREPFEDERSLVSLDQSPDNNNRYISNSTLDSCQDASDSGGRRTPEHIDHDKETYHKGDSSSDADDSSCIEDINFAQKYGIQLKTRRSQRDIAIDRLMKSTHIQESSNEPKPIIKTSITTDCIYHKGTFYQKGDIVALCDQDDGQVYFAQLTGFLQDQYCEKSGSVYWLVPIRPTSREVFDPSAYKIGLEDVQLRKLDCMTFIRHCPHDYYINKFYQSDEPNRPEQSLIRSRSNKNQSYIWTTLKPCQVPIIQTN